jgi:hypothetical protein
MMPQFGFFDYPDFSRVFRTLDSSYPVAKTTYQKLQMLTTIGYSEYENTTDIYNSFLDEKPYLDLDKTIYIDVIESYKRHYGTNNGLLYLKSSINTNASAELTRKLNKSSFDIVIDDPSEVSFQTLSWYAENAYSNFAIIAHLIDEDRKDNYPLHNAKYSFVCGLACGFGKPLIMLAHSPYKPPFDYQDLLYVHDTAECCTEIAEKWLDEIHDLYDQEKQRQTSIIQEQKAANFLQNIYLGDPQAENEQSKLLDYFIITAPYKEALQSRSSILFVGRKGSGKTAVLYKLADQLGSDKRNFVIKIMPVDYELEGVLSLLETTKAKSEQGFLIESLWKFLIYTQLAGCRRGTNFHNVNRPTEQKSG